MTQKPENPNVGDIFRSIRMDDGILSQRAAQQIAELIIAGELRKGDRLPAERELSERLGVSRTVVREAIKLLKSAGMIRVRPGVGSFVTEPTVNILEGPLRFLAGSRSSVIEDLLQVRDLLEPPVAALAAQNANSEHIDLMEQALVELEENVDNMNRYVEADNAFHTALANATQNSVLQLILQSVVDLLQEGRRLAVQSPGAAQRANHFHRLILKAVREGDVNAAREAMSQHMEQAKGEIRTSLYGNRSATSSEPK